MGRWAVPRPEGQDRWNWCGRQLVGAVRLSWWPPRANRPYRRDPRFQGRFALRVGAGELLVSRSGRDDEEVLRTLRGLRPPASFKTSPLPRLDSLLGTVTRAGGGVRGGGGGRPRPFGMLPWRGREAGRRDHQPQLVRELMTRDTSRVMKKTLARRREPFLSGTKAFSFRSQGKIPSARSSRTALAGVSPLFRETPAG